MTGEAVPEGRAPGSRVARAAVVSGRVQGVGFRWSARAQAERLGVSGHVRNLADGRVEAQFEGDADAVAAFEGWLRRGPSGARVDRVVAADREVTGARGFRIER